MIPAELAKELHIIPESIILEAGEFHKSQGQANNWTTKLLEKAAIFRHAGMKPIFLANKDGTSFTVSSTETYMTRLH